jgi:hypothetical protein
MLIRRRGHAQGVEEDDGRLEEIRRSLKSQHGLSMHEVERDGNCLFRAMSKWEWSSQVRRRGRGRGRGRG